MYEIRMPQWGMNMTEGEIVRWFKCEGEHVGEGEDLVEIETAKSTNELQSPISGVLRQILAGEGEFAQVQQVIALIDDG